MKRLSGVKTPSQEHGNPPSDKTSQKASASKKAAFRDPRWPKGLEKHGSGYRYRYMEDGDCKRLLIGVVSLNQAIAAAENYNLQRKAGNNVAKQSRQNKMLARDAFAEYQVRKSIGWTLNTCSRYKAVFDTFCYYLDQNHPGMRLAKITPEIVEQYIALRKKEPIVPNGTRKFTRAQHGGVTQRTLNFEINALKTFFADVLNRELIDHDPTKFVARVPKERKKKASSIHHVLNDDEVVRLLDAARILDERRKRKNARLFDLFSFFLHTGLRKEEAEFLEWSDVDFATNSISLKEKTMEETRVGQVTREQLSHLKKLAAGKAPNDLLFKSDNEVNNMKRHLFIRDKNALRALQVKDINWNTKEVTCRIKSKWQPKGTEGDVPLSATARAILLRVKEENGGRSNFVFAHWDNGHCRIDSLSELKAAQAIAKIPGRLRIHDLRHTCAATLRRRGVPLETIMGVLRHANIQETLVYAPYQRNEGQKAILVLDSPSASEPTVHPSDRE